jgi:hypothetical protein
MAGVAFHAGAAVLHRRLMGVAGMDPLPTAVARFTGAVESYVGAGGTVSPKDVETIRIELEKAIPKYERTVETVFRGWTITGVEHWMPDQKCRLDLIGINDAGSLSFVDLKYKRYKTADKIDWTIRQYEHAWQFKHGQWAFAVSTPSQVAHQYLLLVIAHPVFITRLVELPLHNVDDFYHTAVSKWGRIAESKERGEYPEAATHEDQYGECPFLDPCQTEGLSELALRGRFIHWKEEYQEYD